MFDVFKSYLSSKIPITDEELELIKSLGIIKKLRKRQYLLQAGDSWKYDAFVCKGCLRTYRVDDKGQEHILGFSIENWWTGDRESLLSSTPAQSNIDALEDSVVLLFTHENFLHICHEIPAFNELINGILAKSFVALQNRIHASISYTAEEKYENFLKTSPQLANRVPQSMIASYLGISPETLSRVRHQLLKK
ncbi:Crp/Fnr family transcriptional regulator [Spirosoma jeollabukense]